jgi:hypothetical protein
VEERPHRTVADGVPASASSARNALMELSGLVLNRENKSVTIFV